MAPNIRRRDAIEPGGKDGPRGHRPPGDRNVRANYFPGEVAKILRLDNIDYRQLRRLFEIIDPSLRMVAGHIGQRWTWARYTFRHLVAMRKALEIARSPNGSRLDIKRLGEACATLRDRFQRNDPLSDTQLSRLGETIVATIGDQHFDARTGQRLIDEVALDVQDFVKSHRKDKAVQLCLEQVRSDRDDLIKQQESANASLAVALAACRGVK